MTPTGVNIPPPSERRRDVNTSGRKMWVGLGGLSTAVGKKCEFILEGYQQYWECAQPCHQHVGCN